MIDGIKNFVITAHNKQAFNELINKLDATRQWTANVVERKSKRTIDQNSRYWKLVTEFGEHVGYERDEMHQLMGYKFLRYEKNKRAFIKSTTRLNTTEMADYQDKIERMAAEHGFTFEG